MTSHARGPGDSASAAKIAMYGTIATTLITAAVTVILQVVKPDVSTPIAKESPLTSTIAAASSAQTGSKPPLSQESADGS